MYRVMNAALAMVWGTIYKEFLWTPNYNQSWTNVSNWMQTGRFNKVKPAGRYPDYAFDDTIVDATNAIILDYSQISLHKLTLTGTMQCSNIGDPFWGLLFLDQLVVEKDAFIIDTSDMGVWEWHVNSISARNLMLINITVIGLNNDGFDLYLTQALILESAFVSIDKVTLTRDARIIVDADSTLSVYMRNIQTCTGLISFTDIYGSCTTWHLNELEGVYHFGPGILKGDMCAFNFSMSLIYITAFASLTCLASYIIYSLRKHHRTNTVSCQAHNPAVPCAPDITSFSNYGTVN
jgi:hypothetical protein